MLLQINWYEIWWAYSLVVQNAEFQDKKEFFYKVDYW